MIEETALTGLIGELTGAGSAKDREIAADSVTDLLNAFSTEQAQRVAQVLVRLALAEPDPSAREAELHALGELLEWHASVRGIAQGVCELDASQLSASEQEYLEFICASEPMS